MCEEGHIAPSCNNEVNPELAEKKCRELKEKQEAFEQKLNWRHFLLRDYQELELRLTVLTQNLWQKHPFDPTKKSPKLSFLEGFLDAEPEICDL